MTPPPVSAPVLAPVPEDGSARAEGPSRSADSGVDPESDVAFTWAIAVAALLPRLYVAIAWAREPVWDGHYYDFGARRIAAGLGYSDDVTIAGQLVWHPWCHYPVGYSAFLGLLYRVFGSGPHVATIANAIAGALLVVVVHRLARYGMSPLRARIAATLTALAPGLIVYSALLMTEPLAALGIVAAAWFAVRDRKDKPRRGAVLAGITLGLTTLVRPQSIVMAPALALFFVDRGNLRKTALRAIAIAGVATAVAIGVVAPWTVRNCRVMDGCAFVSTNAGWNLAIGAFPRATGRFETLHATDGCPVVTGQVQQDRCWMNEGLGWIRSDPGRWLGLIPKKLSQTFDHESFPMGYLGEADPAAWPEERKSKGRSFLTAAHRFLLVAASFGVVALPRHERLRDLLVQAGALFLIVLLVAVAFTSDANPFWILAVIIPTIAAFALPGAPQGRGVLGYAAWVVGSVCVTHAIFFGEDRYHVVATPALCLLAAAALTIPRRLVNAPPARSETSPGPDV